MRMTTEAWALLLYRETWELLSYIVTVIGLPFAIIVFLVEQRRARDNEDEAIWHQISDAYASFLKMALNNPDLCLHNRAATPGLSDEQRERMWVIFTLLISLFERAYLLAYSPRMTDIQRRRWNSWEDYMREWSAREDFQVCLPELLRGEDPDFARYISKLVEEAKSARA